jgi:hypothetical protein
MPLLSFNSAPDPDDDYKYTKLTLNSDNARAVKIELWRHSELLFSMPTLALPIFSIRFNVYDLTLNKMDATSVTYSPDNAGRGMEVKPNALGGYIDYNKIPSSPANFGTINARLIFKDVVGPGHYGWLHLDIDFSYPPPYKSDPARYAWQATLLYPRISI